MTEDFLRKRGSLELALALLTVADIRLSSGGDHPDLRELGSPASLTPWTSHPVNWEALTLVIVLSIP